MNIKLGDDIRVRLDREDVLNFKKRKKLYQRYSFGKQVIELELRSDFKIPVSFLTTENQKLIIILNENDVLQLEENSRTGVIVENINIQIDQWGSEKRQKLNKS